MTSGWRGEFVFGNTWAAYSGTTDQNAPHEHAAIQLVLALQGEATVRLASDHEVASRALLIRPLVRHELTSRAALWLVYLEPQAPLARRLLELHGAVDVAPLAPGLAELACDVDTPAAWIERMEEIPSPRALIDPRLKRVLEVLGEHPGAMTVRSASKASGLSPSRLRTLAHEQLGVPLATWLLWRKLEHAGRAMAEGASLADAACAGGFADQAHLARVMRRMFGITPRTAASALA